MSRSAGRWIALSALGLVVIGLGIATSFANRTLVEGLSSGHHHSLSTFADRQDAYIFLQSEAAETRRKVAAHLGSWDDPRAAKLAIVLVPDPDPQVRANLIQSLTAIAMRRPEAIAEQFSTGGSAESAALLEAAASDPEIGLKILELTLKRDPSAANGYLLAKRLGSLSEPILIRMLGSEDENVALSAADAISTFDLDGDARKVTEQALLERYRQADSQTFRDKLLPLLARLAAESARDLFARTALDYTAPSELRAAATAALVALDDPIVDQLAQDADTAVAAVARK
jgi:hypothetical protein